MKEQKLLTDFLLLRDHCVSLHWSFYTYCDLFNDENRDLLDKVAPVFFSDIASIMHRDWILQACKLMDPAETKYKGIVCENITIKLINKQLEKHNLLNKNIVDVSDKISKYGDNIKPARNKRLAHYDRDSQIKNAILGETSEAELLEFLDSLQEYCDLVGEEIGVGPLAFGGGGCSGDVLDFLKYLRGKENA